MLSPILVNLGYVAIHTVCIYLFLVLGLRFIGRRQMGQLTVIDLVIVILMGSGVETAMVNGNTTLYAGIVSAGTLLLMNRGIALAAARSRAVRRFIGGEPILLARGGHVIEENLKRAGITPYDLEHALRARGREGVAGTRFVVMETDGVINVV